MVFIYMKTFKIKEITPELEQEMIRLYTIDDLSMLEIRDICGIGPRRISRTLKKYNIKIKDGGLDEQRKNAIKTVNDNREEILRNYLDDGMNVSEIARKFGLHIPYMWDFLKKNGVEIRYCHGRQHDIDESYFENIDTHEKAYWLGWLFSDGYLLSDFKTVGMNLSIKDECVLEDFRKCLKSAGTIHRFEPPKKKSKIRGRTVKGGVISSFRFKNEKMAKDLIRFGLKPRKSLTLEWPINIEEKYYYSFIRGYIDGDGCICVRGDGRCSLSFYSSSMFLIKLAEFIKLNCDVSLGISKHSGIYCATTGNQMGVLKILDNVYKDENGYPRLDRKYQKYLIIKKMLTDNPIDPRRVTCKEPTINI